MADKSQLRTKSEVLFAEYLDGANHTWEYEPLIPSHTKRPDFLVTFDERNLLCDVKERSPTEMPRGTQCINPVKRIRKLIERGRVKFQEFDDQLCALVVYNNDDFQTRLDPLCIFGAMLGQPGMQFSLDPKTGTDESETAKSVFLHSGGKLIRKYNPLELHESPRNMSAIIALAEYKIRNPVFGRAHAEEESRQTDRQGRPLTDEERFYIGHELIAHGIPFSLGIAPGVTVCVNPFARHPFPATIFKGSYDERWELVNGEMAQVFAGEHRQKR